MSGDIAATLLGLASGMLWGTGDFFGGVASRRVSPFTVVLFGQVIGTVMLVAFVLLLGQPLPPAADLGLGALAGICGLFGIIMFYAAMRVTKMSVAAPVTAVLTVIIPVLAAFALEGVPQAVQLAGMVVALAAVFLISREDNARIVFRDLRLPMLAGLGFGFYLMFLARASDSSPFWPVIAGRLASITLVGVIGWSRGVIRRPRTWADWRLIAGAGFFDTIGNTCYALAAQVGRDDIAAVLSSLYPAATVALAWFVLKERLHRVQWAGVALALAAIVLISL